MRSLRDSSIPLPARRHGSDTTVNLEVASTAPLARAPTLLAAPAEAAPGLAAMLSALPDPALAVTTRNGARAPIVFANSAAHLLLSAPEGALHGLTLDTVLPRLPRRCPKGLPPASEPLQRPLRLQGARPDGTTLAVEVSFGPPLVLDQPGAPVRLVTLRAMPNRHRSNRRAANQHLRAAAQTAARLTSRLDAAHAAETLVDSLVRDFAAAAAEVWTLQPDLGLVPEARASSCGEPPGMPVGVIAIDDPSPLASAARTRTPLVRNHALNALGVDPAWLKRERIRSAAILPLTIGGQVRGVIGCLFRTRLADPHLEALLTLSAIAATVLNDIALHARERDALGRAEAAQRWIDFSREAAEARAAELAAANHELEQQRDALEVARRRLTAQHAVLDALAECNSLDQAAPRILESIGTSLGWAEGTIWMRDGTEPALRPAHVWRAEASESDAITDRPRRLRCPFGEGMVGRVWQTGEAAWLDEVPRGSLARRGESADAERLPGALWFPLRQGGTMLGVVEFLRRDRHPIDEETLRAIASLGHQISGFLQRVQALRAVRDGEERLATTLRSIGDGVITTDLQGRVDFLNPSAESLTGWQLRRARGRPLAEVFRVVHPTTREPIESPAVRALAEGPVLGLAREAVLLGPGGLESLIDDSAAPIRDAAGRLLGVVLVFRDVTEARRGEQRLRFTSDAGALLASSLDWKATLSAVAHRAVEGIADLCSVELLEADGSARSLALARRDARAPARLGPPLPAALVSPGRFPEPALRGESELFTDLAAPTPESPVPGVGPAQPPRALEFRSALRVPLLARGRTFGTILMANASPGRRLEGRDLAMVEELARRASLAVENARLLAETRQALEARDEFLSIASHELRTPLTSLRLQLQSLRRAGHSCAFDSEPRLMAKLELAGRQVERLARLVDDLLEASRPSDHPLGLEPEELDLRAIVRDLAGQFAEPLARAGCPLAMSATGETKGRWDRLQLEQIIARLLGNAIKYGPGRPIELDLAGTSTHVTLQVSDHGIGIPAGDLERIFSRFERAVSARHYGGLGVGLFLVRRALREMGGTITAASNPGAGARFLITLPKCGRPADPTEGWMAPESEQAGA